MFVAHQRVEVGREHDLARLGMGLQSRADVHRVTEGGEVDDGSRADVADERDSGVGGDAERKSLTDFARSSAASAALRR